MNMGEKIKQLLRQNNMTQKTLAEKVGVTETAISHYIKGDRNPAGAILLNLANVLHTTTDYLLSDKEYGADDKQKSIDQSYKLLARNVNFLTLEQKTKFLKLLLQGE